MSNYRTKWARPWSGAPRPYKPVRAATGTAFCPQCKAEFERMNWHHKYCQPVCRERHYRILRGQRPRKFRKTLIPAEEV